MNEPKKFDCVEMKREIQARIAEEEKDLSPEEIQKRRADWLANSDSPAAQLWRRLAKDGQTVGKSI